MQKGIFTIYNSSAGSGKTTTLVKEYLAICLPNPNKFNRIIGITFTNKATAEMKERILRDLQNLISYDKDKSDGLTKNIVQFLVEKTSLIESEIPQKAKYLLERVLHQYSDFAFSTIDSFVMRIVRSFAYELNLALNFEIELDKEELIAHALQELMLNLSKDKNLKRILVEFTLSQLDDERSWNIDQELAKLASVLFESSNYEHIQELNKIKISDYEKAIIQIHKEVKAFEKNLVTLSGSVLNSINESGLSKKDFSYSVFPNYIENISKLDYKKFEVGDRLGKNLEQDVWYSKGKSSQIKSTIDLHKDEWLTAFIEIQTFLNENLPSIKALKLIFRKIYPLAVLTQLQQLIQAHSAENNIIHISESNRRISGIVEQESVPFIYERVGQQYDHYLVDEFQDTSRLQWNNLMPLIENSLAAGNFNMLVGDAKQSIYRWRDGDVAQFVNLQDQTSIYSQGLSAEREMYIKQHLNIENLNENHRSGKEITQFNNRFFEYLLNNSSFSEATKLVYNQHQQEVPKHLAESDGYVQIQLVDKASEADKAHIEEMADDIARLISKQLYHPKDICILGRRHQELSTYAEALNRRDISVVSSDVAEVSKSNNVQFIIAFFRWLQLHIDQGALFHLLQFIQAKDETKFASLFDLCKEFGFGREFNGQEAILYFEKHISPHYHNLKISRLQSLTAYEITEILISSFGLAKNPDIFIQFFMDSILARSRRGNGSINDFLQWWDEKGYKEKVKIPEDLNAVRLFTIHAAKGLQFPVVFTCMSGSKNKKDTSKHWVDTPPKIDAIPKALVEPLKAFEGSLYQEIFDEEKEKQELDVLNLSYVALTRPVDRLYIYANESHGYYPTIQNFLAQSSDFKNTEEGIWLFGEDRKRSLNEFQSTSREPEGVIYQDWQDGVKLHFSQDISTGEEARLAGNLVHEILAWVQYPEDIDVAIQKAIIEKLIDDNDVEEIRSQLQKIIHHPDLSGFFSVTHTIRNEKSILHNGHILRPDRIVEMPDKIVIIDYKLSEHKCLSEKALHTYSGQIESYKEALSMLYNKQVEGYLAFLKGDIKLLKI